LRACAVHLWRSTARFLKSPWRALSALLAGIVGRAYNVEPPIGLNQYVLLLAPTGTGKEAITNGYSALMKSIRSAVPASADFIGPGEMASHQAVIKYMAAGKRRLFRWLANSAFIFNKW
jgi:hypothetical protein